MRKIVAWSLAMAAVSSLSLWAADWPSTGGNPQRDGWSQGETIFSKASVGKIKQLWKFKYDNKTVGTNAMTGPIVLSRLIGYHGFEELVMATGSGGAAYAVDADLGLPYFKTPFSSMDKATAPTSALCPGGQTASMVMWGQSAVSRFGGFGGPNPLARLAAYYTVSSDGYVRTLRAQDGQADMIPPAKMLPANSNVTGLNMAGNTLYAATINGCGGTGNGLYAGAFTPPVLPPTPDLPMISPSKWEFTSFMTNGSGFAGSGGVTSDTKNDMMFGTLPDGKGDVAGDYNDTTLALDAKSLTVKDWFTPSTSAPASKPGIAMVGVTPAVFASEGKDYVIAGGRDGRIYVLDSTALGGSDHHTPLFASEPLFSAAVAGDGKGIYGTFATAVEGGQRWVFAAVHGPITMKFPGANGAAANGGIVAFKLSMTNGRPSLTPAWSSKEMMSPMAPAVANGLLFALSSGMPTRVAKENGTPYSAGEIEKMSKPAVLSIMDAETGAEVFTSGPSSSFSSTGIAVANGHVYFTTHDNMMYAYGVPEER